MYSIILFHEPLQKLTPISELQCPCKSKRTYRGHFGPLLVRHVQAHDYVMPLDWNSTELLFSACKHS